MVQVNNFHQQRITERPQKVRGIQRVKSGPPTKPIMRIRQPPGLCIDDRDILFHWSILFQNHAKNKRHPLHCNQKERVFLAEFTGKIL